MTVLSVKAVCQQIGICRNTLYTMVKSGGFPKPITIIGKRKGYVAAEVEQWLSARIAERDKGNGE